MRKVKALSRLAGGNPRGCNVGIFLSDEAVARAAALFVSKGEIDSGRKDNMIMSYDIYLKEPVSDEVAKVPGHLMIGGTYKADYHSGSRTFTPALNTEAHLNITYNYRRYYKGVYDKGIRQIYGMSGADSIPVLEHMITEITNKYKNGKGWINTRRTKGESVEYEVNEGDTSNYWLATAANAIRPLYQLIAFAKMRPDCVWDGD